MCRLQRQATVDSSAKTQSLLCFHHFTKIKVWCSRHNLFTPSEYHTSKNWDPSRKQGRTFVRESACVACYQASFGFFGGNGEWLRFQGIVLLFSFRHTHTNTQSLQLFSPRHNKFISPSQQTRFSPTSWAPPEAKKHLECVYMWVWNREKMQNNKKKKDIVSLRQWEALKVKQYLPCFLPLSHLP